MNATAPTEAPETCVLAPPWLPDGAEMEVIPQALANLRRVERDGNAVTFEQRRRSHFGQPEQLRRIGIYLF